MLPNIRLMITAILASAAVLSCGFGIFAAFSVSHEPFAHLPAPMALPQLIAETTAAPRAHNVRAGEVIGRQADSLLRTAEDTTTPTTGPEIHATAYAEEPEQKAAPDVIAAAVIDSPAPINTQDKPAAATTAANGAPAQEPTTPSVTVSDLPPLARGEDRASDPAQNAANDLSPNDEPASEATTPSPVAANDAPTERAPAGEPANTTGSSESPVSSAPVADMAPARVANAEAALTPADAAEHPDAARSVALATAPDLPLPRERPSVTAAPAVDAASAVHVRRPMPVAIGPKHPRILIRAIHAPRFPAAYYVQTQYAQSAELGYAYGQMGEAQAPVMVRRVLRPRPATRRSAY